MMTPQPVEIDGPVIETRGIGVSIGGHPLLTNITFAVWPGQVLCVIGPSGAGKTTLLRTLNLLCPISTGSIYAFGKRVVAAPTDRASAIIQEPSQRVQKGRLVVPETHRRAVGMVFQEFNLWEDRSVIANLIEAPLYAAGATRHEAIAEARLLLGRFGLKDLESRRPFQLSGGERQRVAIVRALLMKPSVLLLDEITSFLDPENIVAIHRILGELTREGLTMIIVTHHIEFARRSASQVLVLEKGSVLELGSPGQVLRSPSHKRTQEFITCLEESR